MVISFGSSSSSSRDFFLVFSLRGEGFFSTNLEMPNRDRNGDQFSAMCFRNSLNEERIRNLAMMCYTSPNIEIVVPRECNSVMYPLVGFSSIYFDHLNAGLRIPLFRLLISILGHYTLL